MNQDLKNLIDDYRKLNNNVKFYEALQAVVKAVEVESNSLVQLVVATPMGDNQVAYQYYQQWVSKLPAREQEKLLGAYHGEIIGNFKVIGIYNATPGSEILFQQSEIKK